MLDEVKAWQTRPLDPLYQIPYIDALVVKVRDGHQVRNKAAHIVVGVDLDGVKRVLGIWVQATEGAKSWAGVRRAGQPRRTRHPHRVLRRADRSARRDRGDVRPHHRADLRGAPGPCVAAVRVLPRPQEVGGGAQADLHRRHRHAAETPVGAGRIRPRAAQQVRDRDVAQRLGGVRPLPGFPPKVRRIYTTNAIESLNYLLRKIIKNRVHFPHDDAVIKLLWLAIRDIEDERARTPNAASRQASAVHPAASAKAASPTTGGPR